MSEELKSPIVVFKCSTKLFRHPRRVGDTLENEGHTYLIIGINNYVLYGQHLTIWFTCQDLNQMNYVDSERVWTPVEYWKEVVVRCKYDDVQLKQLTTLGRVFQLNGSWVKAIEYSDIEIDGTDIEVSFYVKPIFPISRKEARAKLFHERRKNLRIELV